MPDPRRYCAGESLEDYCRACKTDRLHTVMAADADGRPLRVVCGYCQSEHNYRGGARIGTGGESAPRAPAVPPRAEPVARAALPLVSERETAPDAATRDLETLIRRIVREETGLTPVAPAEKWRGGSLVLRPGHPGLQEKSWPIETFFHKVVMLRNRLRTLEQQVNGLEVPPDVKVRLQGYITGCYGSLTSFNVLFADAEDQFKGSAGE